jgi:hypothetical protein
MPLCADNHGYDTEWDNKERTRVATFGLQKPDQNPQRHVHDYCTSYEEQPAFPMARLVAPEPALKPNLSTLWVPADHFAFQVKA